MSSRSLKALTFFFFILLLGLISVAVLYTRMQQTEKANRVFQTLVPLTEQFIQTYQTMDSGLRAKTSSALFTQLTKDSGAVLVVIHDSKGEALLLWQATGVPSTSNDQNRAPAYSLPMADLQTAVFETSLPGAVHLVAAFKLLGNDDIQRWAYVILGLLGVWVVFLLVNLALGSDAKVDSLKKSEPAISPTILETSTIRDVHHVAAAPPDKSEPAEIPESPVKPQTESGPNPERDPRFVLIDRKTGVTQERFLRFRLDKELERNAENALDLSVALFRFHGLDKDDFAPAARLLLSEFSHEDLIFEFGNDTFCVVLPQHDLDQAIARSELVMRKADSQKGTIFKRDFELTAGMSSRNGRLIDASRFLKECGVALRKASREEGRIVGFRPDPVRFRNFLRHQRV